MGDTHACCATRRKESHLAYAHPYRIVAYRRYSTTSTRTECLCTTAVLLWSTPQRPTLCITERPPSPSPLPTSCSPCSQHAHHNSIIQYSSLPHSSLTFILRDLHVLSLHNCPSTPLAFCVSVTHAINLPPTFVSWLVAPAYVPWRYMSGPYTRQTTSCRPSRMP